LPKIGLPIMFEKEVIEEEVMRLPPVGGVDVARGGSTSASTY